MSLIIFLLVGLIAGALASYILGRQQDLLVNLLIGIIGAVVGGLLAGLLGLGAYNSSSPQLAPSSASLSGNACGEVLHPWTTRRYRLYGSWPPLTALGRMRCLSNREVSMNNAQTLFSMPGVGFIGMLIIGILAGYIAEKVTSSDHGLLTNLLVGIAGSFVGGTLANVLNVEFCGWLGNLIVATIGAILLLWIWRSIRGPARPVA